jgi:hypothetical protein
LLVSELHQHQKFNKKRGDLCNHRAKKDFNYMFTKFLELNLSLIPLANGQKYPKMNDWSVYSNRLPTVEEAAKWDKLWVNGHRSVGLVNGPASNIISIDLDHPDDAELNAICPPSPLVKRGGKGETRFFRPSPEAMTAHKNGIDILWTGTQTVLPPSIHPDTKKPYVWLTLDTLENFEVKNLPVVDLSFVDRYVKVFEQKYPELCTRSKSGEKGGAGRNNWLMSIVWAKRTAMEAEENIIETIYQTDLHKNAPRLFTDESEGYIAKDESDARLNAWKFVSSVTKSFAGRRAGPAPNPGKNNSIIFGNDYNPGEQKVKLSFADGDPVPLAPPLSSPELFPVDALGKVLGDAVKALSLSLQSPESMLGTSILTAASLAVQAHADIEIDGRVYPTSLNGITIAESGERKSAGDKIITAPHCAYEKKMLDRYFADFKEYLVELQNYNDAVKKNRSSKDENVVVGETVIDLGLVKPIAPINPLFLVGDPTIEGLIKQFSLGKPSMGLYSDEGGSLIGGYGMSKDQLLKTIALLSKFWDGSSIDRLRVEDGATKLYGKRLSLHLMLQPVAFQQLASNPITQGQGILARCLINFPESTMGTRLYNEENVKEHPGFKKYSNLMTEILERSWSYGKSITGEETNELSPQKITLSSTAKTRWIDFYNKIEMQLGSEGDLSFIRAFGSKTPEHALRIAGVLSYIETQLEPVTLDVMERAINITEFYLSEAKRLFAHAAASSEMLDAQVLLDWMLKSGRDVVYTQWFCQNGPFRLRGADTVKKCLQTLVDYAWLKQEKNLIIDGVKRKHAWRILSTSE